jgi:hypothetical protein
VRNVFSATVQMMGYLALTAAAIFAIASFTP